MLECLSGRRDFALLRHCRYKAVTPSLIMVWRQRKSRDVCVRVGYIITRKIGKAVIRNRLRRRLRVIARDTLSGVLGVDVLLIARSEAAKASFSSIECDFLRAITKFKTS